MGIEPKVISESEPISEVTKITNPVGQKNVAGTQVNPATEDTLVAQLNITLSALRDAICDTGANVRTLDDIKTAIDNLETLSAEITKWGGTALTGRDISLDLRALTDVSITGVLKSLGDIGAGTSIQAKLADIETAIEAVNTALQTAGITQVQLAAIKTAVEAAIYRATAPTIYNVTMTNANTEYSQALPANTKKFLIHTRDGTSFRVAFVTGKVATPTEPYLSIGANATYYEDFIQPSSITLYLGCGSAGKVAEIVVWS